jgi:hypothetical protein
MRFAPYPDNQVTDIFVVTHHLYKNAPVKTQKEIDSLIDTAFNSNSPAIQLSSMKKLEKIICSL